MSKKLDPKVAEEVMIAAGYMPLEDYKTALNKWKCRHIQCGATVFVKYNSIQQGKGGCLSCGLQKSAESKKFTQEKATAIMLKKNLKPLEPYSGSVNGWMCECLKCGKVVYPALGSVQRAKIGCEYCAGRKVDAEDAIALMLKGGFRPLEPFTNALANWKSECLKCGKTSSPQYNNVRQGSACTYCSKRKIDENSAVEFMMNADLEPLEPYMGNKVPWKSKCLKCNQIVYPRWNDVQKGHSGCNFCAPKGINLTKPSYLYLITHYQLNAHKVGIGNHKKVNDRLGRFRKFGWETYRVWEFETGKTALEIEAEIFKILRGDLNLPIYLAFEDMKKTQGHTETVGADSISLSQLERIIEKVVTGFQGLNDLEA
jgi:hypothetical protein